MPNMDLKATIAIQTVTAALAALLMCQSTPSAMAASPSFSCSGSLSPTERTICSDDVLAKLDQELAAAYKQVINDASKKDRMKDIKSERAWLDVRSGCGTDRACIKTEYEIRIRQLNEM
jgi:uncharacterized protein